MNVLFVLGGRGNMDALIRQLSKVARLFIRQGCRGANSDTGLCGRYFVFGRIILSIKNHMGSSRGEKFPVFSHACRLVVCTPPSSSYDLIPVLRLTVNFIRMGKKIQSCSVYTWPFQTSGDVGRAEHGKLNRKILVIDDDPALGKLVELILKPLEIAVYFAYSGPEGLKKAYAVHPDLVILDINLPGMDGFEVCARLREFSGFPIMMLTARNHENDVLHGFNVGATDYMKKPFSKTELEARVRALLRRSNDQNSGEASCITAYTDPVLEIDLSAKTVKIEGKFVELSPKEYDLLAYLVREQGVIVSRRELVREVWGEVCVNDLSESSLYIYYLRKKLKDRQYGHQYIRTHWGRGYWFEPRVSDEHSS
jgi:two-component system, OmpR family, response regulator ArlR